MRKIKKEKLIMLYNNNSNKSLCRKLGITNPTLVRLLVANNIPLKGKKRKVTAKKITVVG